MNLRVYTHAGAALIAVSLMTANANASLITVNWVNWSSATTSSATGTAGSQTVTFTGPINPAAVTNDSFTWAPAIYSVDAPDSTTTIHPDIIYLDTNATRTISWTTPVSVLYFATWSMGRAGQTLDYSLGGGVNAALVTGGSNGFSGGSAITVPNATTIRGTEGSGVVALTLAGGGTFSSFTFTPGANEFYHGIQVGFAPPVVSQIPEPGTMGLAGVALMAVWAARRKK